MEPHFLSCGNPLHRRHTTRRTRPLQWSRTFYRAEIPRVRVGLVGGLTSFNGAALFIVRKLTPIMVLLLVASLLQWSRTFYRAEMDQASCLGAAPILCFNGAALFIVRKSPTERKVSQPYSGFNGAALFIVRKCQTINKEYTMAFVLQWSRTFYRAEIRPARTRRPLV